VGNVEHTRTQNCTLRSRLPAATCLLSRSLPPSPPSGPMVKGMGWSGFLGLNVAVNSFLIAWCAAYHLITVQRWLRVEAAAPAGHSTRLSCLTAAERGTKAGRSHRGGGAAGAGHQVACLDASNALAAAVWQGNPVSAQGIALTLERG
jgi:hypothetical protein